MTEVEHAAALLRDVELAARLLRAGELVAFPTETVYGLGADASNPEAVGKVFAAKGRPADHPVIVHLPAAAHLEQWARDVPDSARTLAAQYWPGPLTLVLKRAPGVPDAVTGGQDTVGLRVPDHPLALELLRAFGGGIAAPSANRFGRISPTTAVHVSEDLGDAVALILDGGPCAVGIESTIVDLSAGRARILRPGRITAADIGHLLGRMPDDGPAADVPRVSGSLEAHYAPRTPLELSPSDALAFAVRQAMARRNKVAVLSCLAPPVQNDWVVWQQVPADPAGFARDLYAALRRLDAAGCTRIVVQQPPRSEAWRAVNDRLQRAAAGAGIAET